MTWDNPNEPPELNLDANDPGRLGTDPNGKEPPYKPGDVVYRNGDDEDTWIVWHCQYDTYDNDWYMCCLPTEDHPDFQSHREYNEDRGWVYMYEAYSYQSDREWHPTGKNVLEVEARDLLKQRGKPTTREDAEAFLEELAKQVSK